MKFMNTARKYGRQIAVGTAATLGSIAAAHADIITSAQDSLATAQTGGESVGGTVVGVVCALAVVGVIIALVRKV